MTTFAQVQGNTLIKFPYTAASLQEENPYTKYDTEPDLYAIFPQTEIAISNGYSLVPVTWLPQPSYDHSTEICTQDMQPQLVDGSWAIGWTITPMTAEQQQEALDQTIAANKAQATSLLQATDWVEIPSVSDTNNTPHLVNKAEFMAYRLALRAIAVNPTASPDWPMLPTERWV